MRDVRRVEVERKISSSSSPLPLYSLANMYEMPSFSFLPFGFYCSVECVICISIYMHTYARKRIFYPLPLHNFLSLFSVREEERRRRKKSDEKEKEEEEEKEISTVPSGFLLYVCC